jgi:hypothetical protein
MKMEYSFGQIPHMPILSEITGEFGWSALNFPLKTICNQSEYLPCLQLRLLIWCGKSPLRVENPQWRSRFLFFRYSLLFIYFALVASFQPFSENLQAASPTGRAHWLMLPFRKAPFRKISKQLRRWEGGTHMSTFPSNSAFAEISLRTSKPAEEKPFLHFPHLYLLIIPLSSNLFWW